MLPAGYAAKQVKKPPMQKAFTNTNQPLVPGFVPARRSRGSMPLRLAFRRRRLYTVGEGGQSFFTEAENAMAGIGRNSLPF
jgi:hypothetical protein